MMMFTGFAIVCETPIGMCVSVCALCSSYFHEISATLASRTRATHTHIHMHRQVNQINNRKIFVQKKPPRNITKLQDHKFVLSPVESSETTGIASKENGILTSNLYTASRLRFCAERMRKLFTFAKNYYLTLTVIYMCVECSEKTHTHTHSPMSAHTLAA